MGQRYGSSAVSYSYQKKLTARKEMMRRRRIFFGIVLLLIAVGVFFIVMTSSVKPGNQVFYEGIIIDSIDVSGMTMEEARAAITAQHARKEEALTVTLKFDAQSWEIPPDGLGVAYDTEAVLEEAYAIGHTGSWFARRKEILALGDQPYSARTTMTYDEAALTRTLADIKAKIDVPAADATVEFRPDKEEKFLFSKEAEGRLVDLDSLVSQACTMIESGIGGTIVIKTTPLIPTITVADIEPNVQRIVSVSTSMKGSSSNRTHNIELCMAAFNGHVLQPGESFSFNEVVGPRTEETGYKEATVILRGEYVDDFGGGICQPSTTLYHAVVKADLEVVERNHHSIPSTYVPVGQDATVDYGLYDFVFRNNSEHPVYIRAVVSGNDCEIAMYGRPLPEGAKIEMVTETVSTTPAPEPQVKIDTDGTYITNNQTYVDSPKSRPGYKTKTYKVYYENDQEVKREELSSDTFRASQGTRWVPLGSPLLAPPPDVPPDTSTGG